MALLSVSEKEQLLPFRESLLHLAPVNRFLNVISAVALILTLSVLIMTGKAPLGPWGTASTTRFFGQQDFTGNATSRLAFTPIRHRFFSR